ERRHTNHDRALVSGPRSFDAVAPPQSKSGKMAYPATATANGTASVVSSPRAGARARPTTAPEAAWDRPIMAAPPGNRGPRSSLRLLLWAGSGSARDASIAVQASRSRRARRRPGQTQAEPP